MISNDTNNTVLASNIVTHVRKYIMCRSLVILL